MAITPMANAAAQKGIGVTVSTDNTAITTVLIHICTMIYLQQHVCAKDLTFLHLIFIWFIPWMFV